jgi:DNA helicase-2/ATP-dependent DNA helicase PcrA
MTRDVVQGAAVALTGPAGSGKSTELLRRALDEARAGRRVLLAAPSDAGVARLRALAAAAGGGAGIECTSFGELAFDVLREMRAAEGLAPLRAIDDVRASVHFERAGARLFSLEWTEFVNAEIDPEITGLRAPERFSAAAFRLIRKLRASLVSPEAFRIAGLRGATAFYGQPPNFASADLLMETQPKYRDSLNVTPGELARQHAREVDLVKVLAQLYAAYVEELVSGGCLTPTDAVYEATWEMRRRPERFAAARSRFAAAFVDDAQDLTGGQLGFLEALFGESLGGVTLAGDVAQATRGFAAGARGAEVFKRAGRTVRAAGSYRSVPAIERAARIGLDPAAADGAREPGRRSDAVQLYRAQSARDEARFVAAEAARLIAGGMAPERIAVVTRNLRCAHVYVEALLAAGIPTDVGGAASLYEFPAVLDALAALWSAVDPFRHEYLLRNLEAPWLRLSDASIAVLCGDAEAPQPLLFELPEGEPEEDAGPRWDRRRDLRLGRNVTRGDVDSALSPEARERVEAFRAARERWEGAARTLGPAELARLIFDESVLATLRDDARGRFEGGLVARLIDEVDAFSAREPLGSLGDFLTWAERVAEAEADLLNLALRDRGALRVVDVEAAKGDEFDAVFVVDVRAGAWPRYYVPDAFLFMPAAGMIPKENVGDADAARTAKFTYSLFRYKLREKYNAEERRAFYCAASRARQRLYVSASGRATRGVSAPEILEELSRRL